MNAGYSKEEIDLLKEEMAELDQIFVLVDDEEADEEADYVQFQFVGTYEGKEVIYDAVLSTLSMHHSSRLYEEAEKKITKIYKDFVPYELRDENTKVNEEAELMMEELIQEMEDEETVKVSEFVEVDHSFEFGIGIDAALNVDEITVEVIEDFINGFNNGTLQLDKTAYTFKDGFED
jgi:hypothetical protein